MVPAINIPSEFISKSLGKKFDLWVTFSIDLTNCTNSLGLSKFKVYKECDICLLLLSWVNKYKILSKILNFISFWTFVDFNNSSW